MRPYLEAPPLNGYESYDRETMTRKRMLCFILAVSALTCAMAADRSAGIKASAAALHTSQDA
jgi:hypothetical protein